MQVISKATERHEFWLTIGFSPLDVQVLYQGKVKFEFSRKPSDFSVVPYRGGDRAINTELCDLYQVAYKKGRKFLTSPPKISKSNWQFRVVRI